MKIIKVTEEIERKAWRQYEVLALGLDSDSSYMAIAVLLQALSDNGIEIDWNDRFRTSEPKVDLRKPVPAQ